MPLLHSAKGLERERHDGGDSGLAKPYGSLAAMGREMAGPPNKADLSQGKPIVKISTSQLEAVLTSGGQITPNAAQVDSAVIRLVDADMIQETTRQVLAMPDREELIAALKERIEKGEYNPSGEDIADAMVRRMVADRIK